MNLAAHTQLDQARPELVICIPGPWKDRGQLVQSIASQTAGGFLLAGFVLADTRSQDAVKLEYEPRSSQMRRSFEIAARGSFPQELLTKIDQHEGVVFLHFPVQILKERKRVASFTGAIRRCGGLAVKIESAGIAHEWDRWLYVLTSGDAAELYKSFVVIVRDSAHYYSCGMHHFELPETEADGSMPTREAVNLIDQFNYWQIVERPEIASGSTFSVAPNAPTYRVTLGKDARHENDDPFRNESGVWTLERSS